MKQKLLNEMIPVGRQEFEIEVGRLKKKVKVLERWAGVTETALNRTIDRVRALKAHVNQMRRDTGQIPKRADIDHESLAAAEKQEHIDTGPHDGCTCAYCTEGKIKLKNAPKPRATRVQEMAQQWIGETFIQKNLDYGNSYVVAGKTIELWFPEGVNLDSPLKITFFQLLTRMLDKILRVSNLILRGKDPGIDNEKAYQTIADNGVYSFMTAEICLNGVDDE